MIFVYCDALLGKPLVNLADIHCILLAMMPDDGRDMMKRYVRIMLLVLILALLAGCLGRRQKPSQEPPAPVEAVPTQVVEEVPEEEEPTEEVITANKTPPPFCEDHRAMEFVEQFIWAIEEESGELLGYEITNRGGLNIRLEWWNKNVHFTKDEAAKLFEDDTVYDWGIADGQWGASAGDFHGCCAAQTAGCG